MHHNVQKCRYRSLCLLISITTPNLQKIDMKKLNVQKSKYSKNQYVIVLMTEPILRRVPLLNGLPADCSTTSTL